MPTLRNVSGEECIKILCNRFGFRVARKRGSHVVLRKEALNGPVGTVVPLHKQLKIGTLKDALELAKVDEAEFARFL